MFLSLVMVVVSTLWVVSPGLIPVMSELVESPPVACGGVAARLRVEARLAAVAMAA